MRTERRIATHGKQENNRSTTKILYTPLKAGGIRATYFDNEGRRRYVQAATREAVDERLAEIIDQLSLDRDEADRVSKQGALFRDVAADYQTTVLSKMKAGTQKCYQAALRRCIEEFGDYRMLEVEPWQIKDWVATLPYSKQTVCNHKTVLNNVYKHWVESSKWRGTRNLALDVTVPRGRRKGRRNAPSDRQVEIIKTNFRDPDALLPVALLCTGERKGEMCAIQLRDIDFERRCIYVNKSVEYVDNHPHMRDFTKTPAGIRRVPLLRMLEEALAPYRGLPEDTYIIGLGREPVTATQYNTMWTNFWRKYGEATPYTVTETRYRNGKPRKEHFTRWRANVTSHQLRHEFVCQLCIAGVPIEEALHIVGHANKKMIEEVYLEQKAQMLDDARSRLNAIL